MSAKNIIKRKSLVLYVVIVLFVQKVASRPLHSELDNLTAEEIAPWKNQGF
tara:strand:- start:412 stop:564 length:153 start_codon:yes stop_codon:yes gene_type:complete